MEALPFTIENKPGEPGEITGICRLDDTQLVIEWRKASLIQRHEKADTVCLPLDDLESVTYRGGFFRATLVVRPRHLEPIRGVPGEHESGSLNLQIARRNRATAKELESSVAFSLADYRIERLGKSIGL